MNAASAILACAVCFGEPDSALTKGALAGVILLLGVIVFVLSGIVAVTIFWAKRARMLEASEAFDAKPKMQAFDSGPAPGRP